MATPRTCDRHHPDGTPCTNPTTDPTGWCRACPGFRRPTAVTTRHPVHRGAARHTPTDPPLTTSRLRTLQIPQTAVDAFLAIHGGQRATVRDELRETLTALAEHGTWGRELHPPHHYVLTSTTRGFHFAVIDATLEAVLLYGAFSADRTYLQTLAGVRSRASRKNERKQEKAREADRQALADHEGDWDSEARAFDVGTRDGRPVHVHKEGTWAISHHGRRWNYRSPAHAFRAAAAWLADHGDEPQGPGRIPATAAQADPTERTLTS